MCCLPAKHPTAYFPYFIGILYVHYGIISFPFPTSQKLADLGTRSYLLQERAVPEPNVCAS